MESGEIRFSPPRPGDRLDLRYRTVFGPSVQTDGLIYANSAWNIRFGLRRFTGLRFPLEPGKDLLYRNNQADWFREHEDFIGELLDLFTREVKFEGFFEEALAHHADTHDKKNLRIHSWLDILEHGTAMLDFHTPILMEDYVVWYKIKCDEWAKYGAYPRMIGDLGCPASLMGFRLTKAMKGALADFPLYRHGGESHFIATPSTSKLREVFDNLLNPKGRYYFCYFSDDSCFSIRIGGKLYVFNIDISSCDASHGPALFGALRKCTPSFALPCMDRLLDQLRSPIKVVNPHNKKEKIVMSKGEINLHSGSTLTTHANNVGTASIGESLATYNFDPALNIKDQIIDAAARVGYKVTVECCAFPEAIQFLKHSPAKDSLGRYSPLLNMGVWLRMSGTCRGDLPGKGDLELRAQQFQYNLVQGAFPRTRAPFFDNQRGVTDKGVIAIEKLFQYKTHHDEEDLYFTDSAMLRRYGLTALEEAEVLDFGRCGVGEHISASGLGKILNLDYSLNTVC